MVQPIPCFSSEVRTSEIHAARSCAFAVFRYTPNSLQVTGTFQRFAQAATWSKRWNVPVTCNEFGVYRKTANAQDRAAWISDVRTSLEKHGIGWTMWDYSGGFAVVTKENGKPVPDELTVKALGRTMPKAVH